MNFFDSEKNVDEYTIMAEGYDSNAFIPILREYLGDGASVLELGMDPGKDLELLRAHFQTTGSDNSHVFLNRYKEIQPNADLLHIDAVTIKTNRKFNGIYSNKVLIHLTKKEVKSSFQRQAAVLKAGGVAFHTFWFGDNEEEYNGLRFVYYTPETLSQLIGGSFEIIETSIYTEIERDDSFHIILRKII